MLARFAARLDPLCSSSTQSTTYTSLWLRLTYTYYTHLYLGLGLYLGLTKAAAAYNCSHRPPSIPYSSYFWSTASTDLHLQPSSFLDRLETNTTFLPKQQTSQQQQQTAAPTNDILPSLCPLWPSTPLTPPAGAPHIVLKGFPVVIQPPSNPAR